MAAQGEVVARAAGDAAPLDLEMMIAEFLADSNNVALELPPSLTAEQRKQARKIAEQHPTLKCQSYGVGADRSLHLFKKDCSKVVKPPATSSVSVKNTFIDDWVAKDGLEDDEACEPVVFRSMPVQLAQHESRQLDLSPIAEGVPRAEIDASPVSLNLSASPDTDCAASMGSPLPAFADAEDLKANDNVRNTFIHFEDVPVNERIVQSMPHNMFGQVLWQEAHAAREQVEADPKMTKGPPPIDVGACAPVSPQQQAANDIQPGSEVVIHGLVKLPTFNGLTGVVQSLDEKTGRYSVLLANPTPCGKWWAKVKVDNLRSVVPPPPPCSPMYTGDAIITMPVTPKWEEELAYNTSRGAEKQALNLTALV